MSIWLNLASPGRWASGCANRELMWIMSTDVGRPVLTVAATISWARDQGLYKMEAVRQTLAFTVLCSLLLECGCYVISQPSTPATMPSPPWQTVAFWNQKPKWIFPPSSCFHQSILSQQQEKEIKHWVQKHVLVIVTRCLRKTTWKGKIWFCSLF